MTDQQQEEERTTSKKNLTFPLLLLFFGLAGLGCAVGSLVSCKFFSVTPTAEAQLKGRLESLNHYWYYNKNGYEPAEGTILFDLGLIRTNANPGYPSPTENNDKQLGWQIYKESDGKCFVYWSRDNVSDIYNFSPYQHLAMSFGFISILLATFVLCSNLCLLSDLDGEGRRLFSPFYSFLLSLVAAILQFLTLLFLKHGWCDEDNYGICTVGGGAYLAIASGILLLIASCLFLFVYFNANDDDENPTTSSVKNQNNDQADAMDEVDGDNTAKKSIDIEEA